MARRVRHKKRGTIYTVLNTAQLQMSTVDLVDGSSLVIYQDEDGKWWAREEGEFEDSRFEDVVKARLIVHEGMVCWLFPDGSHCRVTPSDVDQINRSIAVKLR